MKDKIKLSDLLQWRTVDKGFTCYACGKTYIGRQRGLAYCGKMACKACSKEYGFMPVKV